MGAALTRISGMSFVYFLVSVLWSLSSGCLVYGAFVVAVAAMVSVLAWACLGCSFLLFAFRFCFPRPDTRCKRRKIIWNII